MEKKVYLSSEIKEKCPRIRLGCITATVSVDTQTDSLWETIREIQESLKADYQIEDLSTHPINGQTRDGYRACGKKPGRYRPSAEALMRRVLQGKDLYRINNVVDMINMTSIRTGFSIGGYDMMKIKGEITLGVGHENEPYVGLGRGPLNIHKLPVFRDDDGAFGSPTSDSERTGVTDGTTRFLMIFLDFGGNDSLSQAMDEAQSVIGKYCGGKDMETWVVE